jgi:triosephosphate isomerase (TIM)
MKKFIAANWKMNTTVAEAAALLDGLKAGLPVNGVTSVVCPPFVSLQLAQQALAGTGIGLGAQDMHAEANGAFTGEISVSMVAELCSYVILGHSERRHVFGESDESVNTKVHSALAAGLRPIVCVGETLDQREAGNAGEVVTSQLTAAFAGVSEAGTALVAYEPVWAIGTGRAASKDDAQEMAALVRGQLAALFGTESASSTPILYGGSVKAENVADYMAMPDVDGALVGGASLEAAGFIRLTENAAS